MSPRPETRLKPPLGTESGTRRAAACRAPRPQAGLTLIEVLVALALFGVVSTVVLASLPGLYRLNRTSGEEQDVTVHARTVMEGVRAAWQSRALFDAGVLPQLPPDPAGFSCGAPGVMVVDTGRATPRRRRLTLTCTRADHAPVIFVAEFGRP
ncbi:PulJ/GspJ family protein [Deinococcus peraridilitoris]|uniref:Prepilin-type N-terminal cleavage/methylation domain-containing protein n=1 Tax=Deinococcus peraridilitoris (strain DSM 19664 / LMG 22246 / CIP 109416 / KR-200) TaxID=937777 RepID=L0A391_DEIPD|nr:type II secretion system protein [Deinococcus peraridilitoris]AFZ67480.1 prepilin-type N-terminal cleavage/methylation domain-containing protein [Deinococcus peraridilitoris DSM 19664]